MLSPKPSSTPPVASTASPRGLWLRIGIRLGLAELAQDLRSLLARTHRDKECLLLTAHPPKQQLKRMQSDTP